MTSFFDHIKFAYPWALVLLLIIPFILFWYIKNNKNQTAHLPVTTTELLSHIKSYKASFYHILFILRCLALISLIIALAKPEEKFIQKQYEGEGIDIMMCFDVSGSMVSLNNQETAFKPNRLEASKKIAKEFIRTRAGDQIGIVLFSSEALSICPLTIDTAGVMMQLENINPYILNEGGTAIGTGVAACINRLKKSNVKNKIILLLTDGVNTGGMISPDTAIALAKLYNIKIYAVGIGYANPTSSLISKADDVEKSGFDEILLRKMSDETGGKYFNATDETALRSVYNNINSLEKSKITTTEYDDSKELSLPFLEIGFVLILLELILRYTIFRKFP